MENFWEDNKYIHEILHGTNQYNEGVAVLQLDGKIVFLVVCTFQQPHAKIFLMPGPRS